MRKNTFFEVALGAVAVAALMLTLFAPSTSGITYASENDAPPVPKVDPAVERNEAYMQSVVEEGSKIENKSTSGVVSDAPGLYFTNKVTGVAIKANAGASLQGTTVTVSDTDTTKSSAAMSVVNATAAAGGLTVGPSIDIYAKSSTGTGTGSIANMGAVYVGLPATFQGGTSYSAIVVAPGGAVTVLPATLTADGKSVSFDLNGLTDTSRTAGQILVSICKN